MEHTNQSGTSREKRDNGNTAVQRKHARQPAKQSKAPKVGQYVDCDQNGWC
ncbi:hypothetical protein [Thalassobacillus pellis]|uniref:hypothetical protein n=1 Tax=Thalassobacillus pellis TaxID=748008 RepID=UPI0019621C9C|nr:hypothetical protein [Thalassobacillus pellis]MBM7551267.1 hypothetical protein [Thalassobacillus pellis]